MAGEERRGTGGNEKWEKEEEEGEKKEETRQETMPNYCSYHTPT